MTFDRAHGRRAFFCGAPLSSEILAPVAMTTITFKEPHSTHQHHSTFIPDNLILNHRCDLLRSNDSTYSCPIEPQIRHNVQAILRSPHTRNLHPIAWNDERCQREIAKLHSVALSEALRRDNCGLYKSGACRLTQLYLHGGYYVDNDMIPLVSLRSLPLHKSTGFVAVRQSWRPSQFLDAFIAAAPGHPILMKALNMTASFYGLGTGVDTIGRRGKPFEGDFDNAGPWPLPPSKPKHPKKSISTATITHGRRLFWMDTLVLRQAVEWWIGEVLDTEKPSVLSYKHKSAPPPFRNSLLLWEHLPRKTPLVCKPGRLASAYCTARQYARDIGQTMNDGAVVQHCLGESACPTDVIMDRCKGC